ncbi:hypothetical protein ACFS7Z_13840 [Pontibacter toksunensis]|uniref:Uncharacterized protein n=1 Tax=Pontibacter toksunensis TaxID=1332631 RepID=A0ABW6BWY4_9BACT
MTKRIFYSSFKRTSIDLSYVRGAVKEVADETGVDQGRQQVAPKETSSLSGREEKPLLLATP